MVKGVKDARRGIKASNKFIFILAVISIVGFLGIVSETLFDKDISLYVESLFMLIVGVGMIAEGQITRLLKIKKEGLTPSNFTHLITVIIGMIAVLAGLFSFPAWRIETSGFLAVKGILALVAIIIIIIQTWVIE